MMPLTPEKLAELLEVGSTEYTFDQNEILNALTKLGQAFEKAEKVREIAYNELMQKMYEADESGIQQTVIAMRVGLNRQRVYQCLLRYKANR